MSAPNSLHPLVCDCEQCEAEAMAEMDPDDVPRECIDCHDAFAIPGERYCSGCLGALAEDAHDARKESRREFDTD